MPGPQHASSSRRDFGNWLAGFVDGEGCFYAYAKTRTRKNRRPSLKVDLGFTIRLRFDDLEILKSIRGFLGCGSVFLLPNKTRKNPAATFSVSNIKDLREKVVPVFTRFPLRAKKARDFKIWCRAVDLVYKIQFMPPQTKKCSRGWSRWTAKDERDIRKLAEVLSDQRRPSDNSASRLRSSGARRVV